MLDHDTFDVLGRWEIDRGPQYLRYDFWWHLGLRHHGHQRVGHARTWSRTGSTRSCCSAASTVTGCTSGTCASGAPAGARPRAGAPDRPRAAPGARPDQGLRLRHAVVMSLKDLSRRSGSGTRTNGRQVGREEGHRRSPPSRPTAEQLPPALQAFKAVPPLVTDIDLSVDDRFLYVSCWGTGELKQYDVSDPFNPKLTGSVRIGGIVARAAHPSGKRAAQRRTADGRGQPRRPAHLLHQLALHAVDAQFYPDGIQGWMVKLDARPGGRHRARPELLPRVGDGTGRTRCGCRAATPRPTPTAIPDEGSPWLALAGLGAFHGINPGMGWLFAVALGLQRGSRAVVLASLPPIALGHALAVALVVARRRRARPPARPAPQSRVRPRADRLGASITASTARATACASACAPAWPASACGRS